MGFHKAQKALAGAADGLAPKACHLISKAGRDPVQRSCEILSQAVITADDFFQSLNKLIPRSPSGGSAPKRLRDAEFIKVAQWCNYFGHPEWGLRPRTFVILHMIGCTDKIDDFVKDGLTDYAVPYSDKNLPRAVTGQARSRFLDYQNHVLTGQARNLERENGPHQHIEGSADDHFVFCEALGDGASGYVDHVIGRWSLVHFARKRISRGKLFREDRNKIRLFENELSHLKALSHRHLVKLFSSYTDRNCVGLLMTPVADRNLAAYLSLYAEDSEARKVCLRRFFGCMATAVEYLHAQRVRHKDIKPENILVKDQCVLIADFGTSYHWAEGCSSSTHGTVGGFTLRYCAPEVVADKGSRNSSSDVWSLGCVFIEMCTVLCDESVRSMREFFKANGTGEPYVRNNLTGTDLWLAELRQKLALAQDEQILDLCKRMCAYEPGIRPTSSELVAEIFDFESPPHYYGICCDKGSYTTGSATTEDEQNLTTFSDRGLTPSITVEPDQITEQGFNDDRVPVYRQPYVEDIETTIQVFFPPLVKEHVIEEVDARQDDSLQGSSIALLSLRNSQPVKERTSPLEVPKPRSPVRELSSALDVPKTRRPVEERSGALEVPKSKSSGKEHCGVLEMPEPRRPVEEASGDLEVPKPRSPVVNDSASDVTLVSSEFACPWPCCQTFDGVGTTQPSDQDSLREHLRNCHGVHELGRASRVGSCSSPTLNGSVRGMSLKAVHQAGASNPIRDLYAENLADEVKSRRNRATARASSEDPLKLAKTTETSEDDIKPRSPEETPPNKSSPAFDRRVRFGDLPESKRPAPLVKPLRSLRLDTGKHSINAELPGESWCPEGAASPQDRPKGTLPKTTMVPSYILASTNRFSQLEIDLMLPARRLTGMLAPPLFVYGSLMFPSILRARAARYVDPEGVYSTGLARRLITDSRDWSRIDKSLQQAAEQMTPAVLRGFDRYKPTGMSLAYITPSKPKPEVDSKVGEVRGFVIFGLSLEAFDCITHMYSDTDRKEFMEKRPKGSGSLQDDFYGPWFKWEEVDVQIGLSSGETATIEAKTSVWWGGDSRFSAPWDIDRFIRSRNFTKLSETEHEDSIWVEEEQQLAKTMDIKMTVAGDELCDAVLAGDFDKMALLRKAGHSVAAPCSTYGNVLQAACFTGNVDMVDHLLDLGCSVKTRGGQYTTPLIAAVVQGHEEVVRLLLKEGADVLAGGREYTSAIYQAVNFDDVELTHVLLEQGAWLTKDYQELLDLASERDNVDIQNELRRYDVRGLHRRKDSANERAEQWRGSKSKVIEDEYRREDREQPDRREGIVADPRSQSRAVVQNRRILCACLFEAFKLKGRRGKWTGIKAVRVLQAALRAGARESVIDSMRPFLGTYASLVKQLGSHFGDLVDGAPMAGMLQDPGADKGDNRDRKLLCDKDPNRIASTPPPSYSQAMTKADRDEDVICATCDGRGGRKGTGRACIECAGKGRQPDRSRVGTQRDRRCSGCNGTGTVFSARDRCRACS